MAGGANGQDRKLAVSSNGGGGGDVAPGELDEEYLKSKFEEVLQKFKEEQDFNEEAMEKLGEARVALGGGGGGGGGGGEAALPHGGPPDSPGGPTSAFNRLYQEALERKAKIAEMKKAIEAEEQAEVTGAPVLDSRSVEIAAHRFAQEMQSTAGSEAGAQAQPELYSWMLYEEGLHRAAKKQFQVEAGAKERQEAEAREATFKPAITKLAASLQRRDRVEDWLAHAAEERDTRIASMRDALHQMETEHHTFRPSTNPQKPLPEHTLGMTFLERQEVLEQSRRFRIAMKAQEQEQRDHGKPQPAILDQSTVLKREGPIHERLYSMATAASEQRAEARREEEALRRGSKQAWGSGEHSDTGMMFSSFSSVKLDRTASDRDLAGSVKSEGVDLQEVVTAELFEEAKYREERKRELEEVRAAREVARGEQRKMTDSSVRVYLRMMEREMRKVIRSLGLDGASLLTRDQLVHILQQMKMFKPPAQRPGAAHKMSDTEARLLSRLWELLAVDSDTPGVGGMGVDTLYNFLAAVVELSITNPIKKGEKRPAEGLSSSMLGASLGSSFLSEGGLDHDALQPVGQGSEEARVHALAMDFRQLAGLRLAYTSIGKTKSETKEPSFKPKLSDRTQIIAELHRVKASESEAMLDKYPSLASSSSASREHLPYGKDKTVEAKILESRQILQEREMQECTFTPAIKDRGVAPRVTNPVYNSTVSQRKAKKDPSWQSDEEKALAQCTFHPRINKAPPSSKARPQAAPNRAEQKAIERMRAGTQERERKAKALDIRHVETKSKVPAAAEPAQKEKVPTPKEKTTKPEPFKTHWQGSTRKPVLYIDVMLGGGKKGRIGVCHNDQPQQLAVNFAKAYQLDDVAAKKLEALIESRMQEVVPT